MSALDTESHMGRFHPGAVQIRICFIKVEEFLHCFSHENSTSSVMNSSGALPAPSLGDSPNITMLNFLHFSSSNGGCQVPSSQHPGKRCINPTGSFAWRSHFCSNQQPFPPSPLYSRDQRYSNLPPKLPPCWRGVLGLPSPIPRGCSHSLSKEASAQRFISSISSELHLWPEPSLGHNLPSSLPLLGQFHRFLLLPRAASRELRRGIRRDCLSQLWVRHWREMGLVTTAAQWWESDGAPPPPLRPSSEPFALTRWNGKHFD